VGPNGTITVPKGANHSIEVDGLTFAKFGDLDLRIAIDLDALHEEFSTINSDEYRVYLKGTMNSWTPVQLLDDGKNGDESAGDQIFSYQHSTKLGPHDGLAFEGQHVQFVFVFAIKGDEPADGLEYKFPIDALPDGVSAWSKAGEDWRDEEVILEPDSYGKVQNTTIVVSALTIEPQCDEENPCPPEFVCEDGQCVPVRSVDPPMVSLVDPAWGPAVGGMAVTVSGSGFVDGATVAFGEAYATEVKVLSLGTIECVTPAGSHGEVDVRVQNPDGQWGAFGGGFTYAKPKPDIFEAYSVSPNYGVPEGGDMITISGNKFTNVTDVWFIPGTSGGTVVVKEITVVSDTQIVLKTPPGALGAVGLKVNIGGEYAFLGQKFHYAIVASPTVDGAVSDDWPAGSQLADDSATQGWDNNDLNTLWLAFDADYLYLGISGQVEDNNSVVVYLDTDFGAGTGVLPNQIEDNDGTFDNALSASSIAVTVDGFGADFAAGSRGANGQKLGEGLADAAGFRGLSNPADLAWLAGDVVWLPGVGVEMRVPWSTLELAPDTKGRTLAAFARIVNDDGSYCSPEGLPSAAAEAAAGQCPVTEVVQLWVP
jgi:hypothetical protein